MDDVSYAINELDSIIRELEDIQGSLGNFKGINSEKCAQAIGNQIEKYRKARTKLNSIDKSKVDE